MTTIGTTIEQNGGTITISQDTNGIFKYIKSIDSSQHIINSFPITFKNTTTTSETLTVSINSQLKINQLFCFICGSSNITIDGQNNQITYSNTTISFNGLVQNGTNSTNGFSNVTIKKIILNAENCSSTVGEGWICRSYFGRGASNNQISNCTSNGRISYRSGGICGSYACSYGGNLTISNCGSSGVIGYLVNKQPKGEGGGICGALAAYSNGKLLVEKCYSSGHMNGSYSGGIVGRYSCFLCDISNAVEIKNCYSIGDMNYTQCCGIVTETTNKYNNYGPNIYNCYSQGKISSSCYGIAYQARNIENSYSSGLLTTNSVGLCFYLDYSLNNYVANGANNWSDANANKNLTGVPLQSSTIGIIWKSNKPDTPYFLK
jgi:hypothetical protein